MMSKRTLSPIGVDIDRRCISAVQLYRRIGSWSVHAAAVLPRLNDEWPPTREEIQRLGDVLSRQGFVGNRLALAVPNDMLITGVLDTPPINSGAPIEQIARMELARIHKHDPDSLELCWWELPSRHRTGSNADSRTSANIMAAGCVIDDVIPLLDVFEDEHWDVKHLGTSSWAMVHACNAMFDSSVSTAFLDFRWFASTVTLQHKGDIVYQRTFEDAGLHFLHGKLMKTLGCTADAADVLLGQCGDAWTPDSNAPRESNSRRSSDANRLIAEHTRHLIQEVRASCSYLIHRFADALPQTLVAAGPGTLVPGLLENLSRGLEMDVLQANSESCVPGNHEQPPKMVQHLASYRDKPSLVIPLGLAMVSTESSGSSSNRLDLVPRSRRLAKHRLTRKRLWITAISAYALVVMACVIGARVLHVFDSRAVAAQLELLESHIQKASIDAKSLQMQLKQVKDAWETANVVNSQPDWSLLLALIAQVGEQQVSLHSCDISSVDPRVNSNVALEPTAPHATSTQHAARWALNLSGRGRTQNAVSQFVLQLEQFMLFEQVRLVETRREPSGESRADDQFVFLITCTMN